MITYQASAEQRAATIERDFAANTEPAKRVKELRDALMARTGP